MSVPEEPETHDTESSRVFVTGLPPNLTSEDLRKHFSTKYQITDAHVLPGRRIGFVGLKDHEAAQNAIKYFNKTFIRMSKINVEAARPIDIQRRDGQQARPISNKRTFANFSNDESRNATGSNAAAPSASATNALKRKRGQEESQTENQEPQRTSNTASANEERSERPDVQESDFAKPSEQVPEMTQNPTTTDTESEAPVDPVTPADDDDWLRSKTSRLLDLDESKAPAPAVQKDHSKQVLSAGDGPVPEAEFEGFEDSVDESKAPEAEQDTSTPFPSKRLFVRNLPFTTEASDLRKAFSTVFPNKVEEVHIVQDQRNNTNKGFAYVSFKDAETAGKAALEFDGKPMQGRILHVLPAIEKTSTKLDDFELSKLPLKKQKLIKRKTEAGTNTLNWNSLFMNSDAVISSIANRLGVAKSQVLDPTSSDAAVKQAQAETHVIQETKTYFMKFGVDFDSFNDKPRGGKSLLVKNLAYGTSADELKTLFNVCGEVTRLLLPPSGVIAIVEFEEVDQAQRAMKQLAYRNVKGTPLYLEKAPTDLFTTAPGKQAGEGSTDDAIDAEKPSDEVDANAASYTLFVRNLNFSTTSSGLADAFKPLEGFLSAKVKTRTDSKRPGEILSMGYGFVDFRTKQQAQIALKAMNGHRLDNHELLVKVSQQATDAAEERRKEDAAKKSAANRTKIIIKNLPFEATKKDIRTLLGGYGQLRSVRLPKKFNSTTRGFAFAEFVTAREAENAMDALKNTHLLGRRLVLDFATADVTDPEEEIRAMEKKMGQQAEKVELQKMTGPGRKKFVVGARDEDED